MAIGSASVVSSSCGFVSLAVAFALVLAFVLAFDRR
jgi:hypothetical protein